MLAQSLIDIWQIILDIGGPFIIPVGFFFAGVVGYLVLLYLGRAGITNTQSDAGGEIAAQHRQRNQLAKVDDDTAEINTSESVHADDHGDDSTTDGDVNAEIPE
jgi:hypothetical protein